ncbi:unnamed protein product [Anisakis simplex]|uniref:CortBP2 domain-containing protein n=1 Tax=Anisakis simplex TaxID=6269 RepID=A0A0M3JXK0_ANISI|nr:unnamed protein product [Anisakis simplex]
MDTLKTSSDARKEFSNEDLLRLLSYLEGELQARDIVIAALKSEKAKQLLYRAKYGRLNGDDPLNALQRDSNLSGVEGELNETQISQMYESQLSQLERLIAVQRRCHLRSKQVIELVRVAAASSDAAHGDDLCALLENERTKLRQQLEYEQKESDKTKKEIEKLEKKLLDEKDRHKSMVLFLINERKQMLVKMHELRMQSENTGKSVIIICLRRTSTQQENVLLDEMRTELTTVRKERDQLRTALNSARQEAQTLKEAVRSLEEDLAVMCNNMMSGAGAGTVPNSRIHANNVRLLPDGSVVLTNKAASASSASNVLVSTSRTSSASTNQSSSSSSSTSSLNRPVDIRSISSTTTTTNRSRLSSSSSFPSDERTNSSTSGGSSAVNNIHLNSSSQPSRVPLPTMPLSSAAAATIPPSPTRRHIITNPPPSSSNANRSRQIASATSTGNHHHHHHQSSTSSTRNVAPTAAPDPTLMPPSPVSYQRREQHHHHSNNNKTAYATEPEIEQLGAVIQSMNSTSSSSSLSSSKSSKRNVSAVSQSINQQPAVQHHHSQPQHQMNSNSAKHSSAPPSSTVSPNVQQSSSSYNKISTPKRSVLFKAFGVSCRSADSRHD